ncbi:MAG TPA: YceI family protein [Candidatus Tectomicrobia bacterium]|jgi:polyisoprenoid-binding protein YceI
MLRRYRTLALLGWLLGWELLLSMVLASATERYVISLPKSQFQFKAYSLLNQALGTFHTFAGEIVADAQHLSASQVRFVIDAASIDTKNEKRDKHIRSKDFLFVEKFPQISFVSTTITKDGLGYAVQGDLEIRGVTKRVTIPVTVEQRRDEMVVQGSISLNRKDFGVNYNAFFNPVQNEVDVVFTIVGAKP